MIRTNAAKRIFVLSSLVVVALVVTAVLLVIKTSTTAATSDWPPFSMVYEIEGARVTVGPEIIQMRPEVRRLEYRSKTEWVDTVIEAPSTETRVGVFSRVGSWQRLSGRDFTEFDSIDNSTLSEKVDEGVRRVPVGALIPSPIHFLENAGFELTRVPTSSKVCFLEACEENAEGLLFVDNGRKRILADDSRGIPLKVGDSFFVVRELRIGDVKR